MKKTITILVVIVASIALTAGIVRAASEYNITRTLGGASGDYFTLDGTLSVGALKVGAQSVGGVTFFNGSIVNNTTNVAGADNPVTFGDNVRIDGRVWRGATAGTGDTMPFIVNDNMEVKGNFSVEGSLTVASDQIVDVTGATVSGLSTEDLADGATLTKSDTAATLTADWVNTAYPWSADEVADTARMAFIPLSGFYTDANGTPAAITGATVPALNYTANQGLYLRYVEDDTADIGTQLVVPEDYASGGVFKAVVDTSAAIVTDWDLDFQVAISETAGTAAWATAMANETPVDIPDNAGTPSVITFTPTSQSDISAGDTLFFDLWPDSNTAAGEPNVEIYAAWFEYTSKQ